MSKTVTRELRTYRVKLWGYKFTVFVQPDGHETLEPTMVEQEINGRVRRVRSDDQRAELRDCMVLEATSEAEAQDVFQKVLRINKVTDYGNRGMWQIEVLGPAAAVDAPESDDDQGHDDEAPAPAPRRRRKGAE